MQHKKSKQGNLRCAYPLLALSLFLGTPLLGGVNRTIQTTNWHLPKTDQLLPRPRDPADIVLEILKIYHFDNIHIPDQAHAWRAWYNYFGVLAVMDSTLVRWPLKLPRGSHNWWVPSWCLLKRVWYAHQSAYINTQMMTSKWAHAVTRTESQKLTLHFQSSEAVNKIYVSNRCKFPSPPDNRRRSDTRPINWKCERTRLLAVCLFLVA